MNYIEIGGVKIEKTAALAPMASVADRAYRIMAKEYGAAYVVGEMASCKGLCYNDRKTAELLRERGFVPVNIDATVIAQKPKIAAFIPEMVKNIAADCGIDPDCVNVKATTEEGLGFTGNLEGISAHAVCLIERI